MKLIEVDAPTAGSILSVLARAGQAINAEDELIIIESMKMEIPVTAPASGRVAEVLVKESDPVDSGDVLVRIEAD